MNRLFRLGGYLASGVLILFGAGSIVIGALGFMEVRDTIAQEKIEATPDAEELGVGGEPGEGPGQAPGQEQRDGDGEDGRGDPEGHDRYERVGDPAHAQYVAGSRLPMEETRPSRHQHAHVVICTRCRSVSHRSPRVTEPAWYRSGNTCLCSVARDSSDPTCANSSWTTVTE